MILNWLTCTLIVGAGPTSAAASGAVPPSDIWAYVAQLASDEFSLSKKDADAILWNPGRPLLSERAWRLAVGCASSRLGRSRSESTRVNGMSPTRRKVFPQNTPRSSFWTAERTPTALPQC